MLVAMMLRLRGNQQRHPVLLASLHNKACPSMLDDVLSYKNCRNIQHLWGKYTCAICCFSPCIRTSNYLRSLQYPHAMWNLLLYWKIGDSSTPFVTTPLQACFLVRTLHNICQGTLLSSWQDVQYSRVSALRSYCSSASYDAVLAHGWHPWAVISRREWGQLYMSPPEWTYFRRAACSFHEPARL